MQTVDAEKMRTASTDDLKRAAAERAAEWIVDGMVLGLGTGSTVRYLLDHIAVRRESGGLRQVSCIATSEDTARRAKVLGIPLSTLARHPRVDMTIDGADEVDPEMRLIKGLGGALLREKIVAVASSRNVIIVDETKLVDHLGRRAPLPVEVDPFGAEVQRRFLDGLRVEPVLRLRPDGSEFVTDGGNRIFDCRFPTGIDDPEEIDRILNNRPGILGHGLFLALTDVVVVAESRGVRIVERPHGREVA